MKKLCSHAHWEVTKTVQGADTYCMKESTRIEGPWTYGIPPKVNQNTVSVDKARIARAELNAKIHQVGPLESLQTGLISYKDYTGVKRARDMILLDQQVPTNMD